jgi:hypothetical protein
MSIDLASIPAAASTALGTLPIDLRGHILSLLSLRGQFASIRTRRPVKVKKGGPSYVKESRMVVRLGVDYDNQKMVAEKREDGTLPATNQGLIGREWLIFPYLMRSEKSGKMLMRVTPVRTATSHRSTFWLEDREVTRDEVKEWAYAAEFAERETPDAFDLTVDNIVEVNGVEV